MKRTMSLAAFCVVAFASVAAAYNYPLQFTPNPGYRDLVVAGYSFEGNSVVGNCSYHTVSGNAGRTSKSTVKSYLQTCRWDHFGNLLSITKGAPAIPAPLYVQDNTVVYAVNTNGDYTGTDVTQPGRGFVNTIGAHYTWLTPQSPAVVQQLAYTLTTTLQSDGDMPLSITAVVPSATLGSVSLKSTTCIGETAVGDTCSIVVTYDPTRVAAPKGQVQDTLRIDVNSNAGASHDFVQAFTVLTPKN